mmetsp:Transcript_16100/g.65030  ORF Transcript_16100/g.65030 Transcript_16100/m.65030 type:complete len:275 (+) Transcript_16100:3-827(+)
MLEVSGDAVVVEAPVDASRPRLSPSGAGTGDPRLLTLVLEVAGAREHAFEASNLGPAFADLPVGAVLRLRRARRCDQNALLRLDPATCEIASVPPEEESTERDDGPPPPSHRNGTTGGPPPFSDFTAPEGARHQQRGIDDGGVRAAAVTPPSTSVATTPRGGRQKKTAPAAPSTLHASVLRVGLSARGVLRFELRPHLDETCASSSSSEDAVVVEAAPSLQAYLLPKDFVKADRALDTLRGVFERPGSVFFFDLVPTSSSDSPAEYAVQNITPG